MASNFLMGGKLGDFLHALYAVKNISEKTDALASVYMYDIGWEHGINNTFQELKPLLEQQSYIESLHILKNYELNPVQTPNHNTPIQVWDIQVSNEGFTDLGGYIRSPWLYKACWSEIYSKTFNFSISSEYQWIKHSKKNESLKDKVLIHRRFNPARINNSFPYAELIEKYNDRVVFVGASEQDYANFPLKDKVEFYKTVTLDEWFTAINSCYMTISNLTSFTSLSHAFDKKRIIELPESGDSIHCMGEEKYSSNVQWYLNNQLNTVTDI